MPVRGRLQRPPDFTGARLTRFSQVFARHGLPGLLLALLCLSLPVASDQASRVAELVLGDPARYLGLFLLAAAVLVAHSRWSLKRWDAATLGWVFYLGLLSCWEEWAFRVILPAVMEEGGLPLLLGIVVANVAFGAVHYFTLRWRWQWCVAAALGGLALSRHFHQNEDFLLLVLMHWIGTTLNTPRLPSVVQTGK